MNFYIILLLFFFFFAISNVWLDCFNIKSKFFPLKKFNRKRNKIVNFSLRNIEFGCLWLLYLWIELDAWHKFIESSNMLTFQSNLNYYIILEYTPVKIYKILYVPILYSLFWDWKIFNSKLKKQKWFQKENLPTNVNQEWLFFFLSFCIHINMYNLRI